MTRGSSLSAGQFFAVTIAGAGLGLAAAVGATALADSGSEFQGSTTGFTTVQDSDASRGAGAPTTDQGPRTISPDQISPWSRGLSNDSRSGAS